MARAQEEEGDCGLEQEQGGNWHFLDQVLPESRLGSLYFWLQQELKVSQTTKLKVSLSTVTFRRGVLSGSKYIVQIQDAKST